MSLDRGPLKQMLTLTASRGSVLGDVRRRIAGETYPPSTLTNFAPPRARRLIKFNLFCFAPAKRATRDSVPINLADNPCSLGSFAS